MLDILLKAIIISLLSSFLKFVLSRTGISQKVAEFYDTYKKDWMPKRCNYCFNIELCLIVWLVSIIDISFESFKKDSIISVLFSLIDIFYISFSIDEVICVFISFPLVKFFNHED